MKLQLLEKLKRSVEIIYHTFGLKRYEHTKGRKPALSVKKALSLGLYRHSRGTVTKRSLYEDLKDTLGCSYKTFVVTLNKYGRLIATILVVLMNKARTTAHPIKHIDATDLPVCLTKNGKYHKTMKALAAWSRNGKGLYYGLKLHIVTDLKSNILGFCFTPGNTDDRVPVSSLLGDMPGIFIADAGYTGEQLAHDMQVPGHRIFMARARKNMKKLMSEIQQELYNTRMMIEFNFRSLKMFYGLVTSLPRSVDGYLANYLYAILAFVLR
jgi:hypothetical protein